MIDGSSRAPLLVFGWGNPSRGDDALGSALVDAVAALNLSGVECITDFQLQMDDCLELKGRRKVLFVDASKVAAPPFTVEDVEPRKDASFTSHAMTAQAVMQVYLDIEKETPPPCQLLGIRGETWGLGEAMSVAAQERLALAVQWVRGWARDAADPSA